MTSRPPDATPPPILLADVRLDAVDEADLRWLFCEAAGEMGERSALGAMIDRLNEGRTHTGQSGTPDLPTSQYLAARAARPLAARLEHIGKRHARTLEAAYGPGLLPASAARFAGLGSGATLPDALVLLAARRTKVSFKRLEKWLTSPKEPKLPKLSEKSPDEAKAILAKHAKEWRAIQDQHASQVADHLRPVRLAAQMQLAAAHDAYRATYRLHPRQPRGRVDAE